MADICEQLRHVGEGTENTEAVDAQRIETGQGYRWHYFDGNFHPVPKDWHFPRIGVLDAWKQWWIGDSVRGSPPLRMLDSKDLEFLDAIPLTEEEQHGRTGPNKNRRRPARTTLCDLKFLMMYIQDKVVAAGRFTDVIRCRHVQRGCYRIWWGKKFAEEMAHNFTGDPKEHLEWWQWGKCYFSL